MEQFKPEGEQKHYLDLDTQVSSVEFTDAEGRKRLIIRRPNGTKAAEIIYHPNKRPMQVTQFSENNQEQVFTDPKILAEVDEQVRGLLGEKVEEPDQETMTGATQDGPSATAEDLKIRMAHEDFIAREALQKFGRKDENPKGH